MSPALVPCTACSRHVAVGELACPFCGAPPPAAEGPVGRSLRASRAALFAAGAGTLLATTACSQTTTPNDRDASPVDAVAPDAPSNDLDAGPDGGAANEPDAGPIDATPDVPTVQPAYGGVIFSIDASSDANQP
jgi:hypothetical protein